MISTSFTILSFIISVITLVVAIILFDRFGFNAKFKEKQLDTVLILIEELKLLSITINTENHRYINFIRVSNNLKLLPADIYNSDKNKTILLPSNIVEILRPIYILYNNSWLPLEIKEKMKFLDIYMIESVNDFNKSKYVKLNINNQGVEPWCISEPTLKFDAFSNNLSNLLTTILTWVRSHSSIDIDFDLINIA